ncbi:MAG: hypothetical protein H7836_17270 [Magnetococcus sp. YQC-3]
MATLVRIRLPNRSEYKKILWGAKKDYFVLKGNNYHIDYNKAFFTSVWGGFLKVSCLDYEHGKEEPVEYFRHGIETSTELRPHHVADVIRRLIEEIPHFQLIVLILLLISLAVGGIAVYLSYSNGDALSSIKAEVHALYNNSFVVMPR